MCRAYTAATVTVTEPPLIGSEARETEDSQCHEAGDSEGCSIPGPTYSESRGNELLCSDYERPRCGRNTFRQVSACAFMLVIVQVSRPIARLIISVIKP